MPIGIKQLRNRFAAIDLPVDLNAHNAKALKDRVPRERLLQALTRVETANDTGARAFLVKTMGGAGLLINTNVVRSQAANTGTRQAMAPTQAPPEPGADRPNAPATNPPSQQNSNNGQRPYRPSHHVYGGKAAVMFELDETKAGTATVALDCARAIAERQYDWKDKVRIQLTAGEVPVVAATLFGMLPKCQFVNHGPGNDKGFAIEWQSERGSFFVKVWQGKGNLRAVPMTREDAYHVGQIVLCALQQVSPARLDATGALNSLRALYART